MSQGQTIFRQAQIYRLNFRAPVHFGDDSSGLERSLEYLQSDTLFGAVCFAWAMLFGAKNLETLILQPSLDNSTQAPLLLSSAFIYKNDIYYLPKPQLGLCQNDRRTLDDYDSTTVALGKELKDNQFIPSVMWQKWIRQEEVIGSSADENELLEILKLYSKSFNHYRQPRNYIPRGGGETEPYFCDTVIYEMDKNQTRSAGLYFIADFANDQIRTRFEQCLDYLKDSGLGGERSSGYGVFDWLADSFSVENLLGKPISNPTGYVLLSVATPDAPLEAWHYQLVRRRGFALTLGKFEGETRKKSLLFFAEGSVFTQPARPTGMLHCVLDKKENPKLPHSVYRSGLALAYPYFATQETTN